MELKDVKSNLGKIVMLGDVQYTLTACIMRQHDDGSYYYQAELLDKCGRSVTIIGLEKVREDTE